MAAHKASLAGEGLAELRHKLVLAAQERRQLACLMLTEHPRLLFSDDHPYQIYASGGNVVIPALELNTVEP